MIKSSKRNNEDIEIVLSSRFFSYYKGIPVFKLPIGCNAASLGIIILGRKVKSSAMLLHEYGHTLQLKSMGFFKYLFKIFIPSITANILDKLGKLPYDYYGSHWEKEADILGHVSRKCIDWPADAYSSYSDLIKMFKNKSRRKGCR